MALYTNWKLSFVILASVPVAAVGVALISRRIQENTDRHGNNLTQAVGLATFAITNILLIKCFNTKTREQRNYAQFVKAAAEHSLKLAFSQSLQNGFTRFISNAMVVQGKFNPRTVLATRDLIFFSQVSGMADLKYKLVKLPLER